MKKMIGVIIFILLLVGCVGNQLKESNPEEVLESFVSTLVDINYEGWKEQYADFQARKIR